MYIFGGIIDETEKRHRAGHLTEIFLHTLLGSKGEFALFQPFFDVVYGKILFTIKNHQIMTIAFVVKVLNKAKSMKLSLLEMDALSKLVPIDVTTSKNRIGITKGLFDVSDTIDANNALYSDTIIKI